VQQGKFGIEGYLVRFKGFVVEGKPGSESARKQDEAFFLLGNSFSRSIPINGPGRARCQPM